MLTARRSPQGEGGRGGRVIGAMARHGRLRRVRGAVRRQSTGAGSRRAHRLIRTPSHGDLLAGSLVVSTIWQELRYVRVWLKGCSAEVHPIRWYDEIDMRAIHEVRDVRVGSRGRLYAGGLWFPTVPW